MSHMGYKQLHRSPVASGPFNVHQDDKNHAKSWSSAKGYVTRRNLHDLSEFELTSLHFHLPIKQDCQYGIINWHNQHVWADEIVYRTLHFRQQTQLYLNVWPGILEFRLLDLSSYGSHCSCVPWFTTKYPPKTIAKCEPPDWDHLCFMHFVALQCFLLAVHGF